MTAFFYRAKKNPRDVVEGIISADSMAAAVQKIFGMGFYLLRIEEERKKKNVFLRKQRKVPLRDTAHFTRQLSDLLGSGLTIVKALKILSRQTESRALGRVISEIRDACVEGDPFSKALERFPDIFSNLYINLVRSGEAGGALEDVLRRLADHIEKQLEIQTKVRSAMAYPALMSFVGLMTILVLLTFVIPKITGMFEDLGQSLPMPTLILMKTGDMLKSYGWMLLPGVFIAGAYFKKICRTPKGKISFDGFKFRIPYLGTLMKKIETARFVGTLGMLLKNGVPMLSSLDIVSQTMNNALMEREITKVSSRVREGASLAGALQESPVMPVLLVNMVGVGEEGGKIDDALMKLAGSYEREFDANIKILMSLLEPALILVLGAVVGFIVISMLLPIFEINFLVR